jgi:hypothetical protein
MSPRALPQVWTAPGVAAPLHELPPHITCHLTSLTRGSSVHTLAAQTLVAAPRDATSPETREVVSH